MEPSALTIEVHNESSNKELIESENGVLNVCMAVRRCGSFQHPMPRSDFPYDRLAMQADHRIHANPLELQIHVDEKLIFLYSSFFLQYLRRE